MAAAARKSDPSSPRNKARIGLRTSAAAVVLVTAVILRTMDCGVMASNDVYYNWTLNTFLDNAYSPDCMNEKDQGRFVFLVERSSPGPTIEVNEGDTVHVRKAIAPALSCRFNVTTDYLSSVRLIVFLMNGGMPGSLRTIA
jgi:hypothetical protein